MADKRISDLAIHKAIVFMRWIETDRELRRALGALLLGDPIMLQEWHRRLTFLMKAAETPARPPARPAGQPGWRPRLVEK